MTSLLASFSVEYLKWSSVLVNSYKDNSTTLVMETIG